ncbi:MAG: hypothetical protein P0116_02335 [Candidatus Nitrosocosmicus sp.]|nr:hypothetical protein [Candidatus Nitrosocosmicus sp.]
MVDSLKHDAVVKDHKIKKEIVPIELKSFKESLEYCLNEENSTFEEQTGEIK